VNLSDVGFFSPDFSGPYAGRSDFDFNGVINRADRAPLAAHIGHTLPAGAITDPVD